MLISITNIVGLEVIGLPFLFRAAVSQIVFSFIEDVEGDIGNN